MDAEVTARDLEGSQIVATTQQTRFHVAEQSTPSEIHLSGLHLSIISTPSKSQPSTQGTSTSSTTDKKKGRASREHEILVNANLDLKSGVCYGLIGRNGSGKSTLLRALSERLIPGLTKDIKIACLQQTGTRASSSSTQDLHLNQSKQSLPVLQYVMESDEHKAKLEKDLATLHGDGGDQSDPVSQLRRYRVYQYEKMRQDLLELEHEASFRSGQRGARVRKELLSFREDVSRAKDRVDEDPGSIELEEVQTALSESIALISQLQDDLNAMNLIDTETSSRKILYGLGFDEAMMQKPVAALSGGWKMRCHLAAVLYQSADIMILDEPTNFLDLLGILWLQHYLQEVCVEATKTIILVSHDRAFIDETCSDLIILRDKSLAYFKGNLTEYDADLRSRIKYLTRMQEAQDKESERLEKTIRTNIKQGKAKGDDNKLRMAKSRQKKLESQSGMLVSATGGRFKLSRDRAGFQDTKLAAIEIPTIEAGVSLSVPLTTELRNPGPLVSMEKVRYKHSKAVSYTLDGIDLTVRSGDRVGIMGLNGAGKTTLIKVLIHQLRPSSGTVSHHPKLKLGYFSQHMVEEIQQQAAKSPGVTAFSLIRDEAGDEMSEQDIMALLGSYGLPGRVATQTPIATLSGGQCVRLAFCRIIWNAPNLLVLDEISTHLDHHTVTALADALDAFEGAIILVSHDRYLVRRLIEGQHDHESDDENEEDGVVSNATKVSRQRTVYSLGNGKLKVREGGVSQFEAVIEKKVAKLSL